MIPGLAITVHPHATDPRTIVVAALAGLASATAGPDVRFGRDYRKVAVRLGLVPGPGRPGRKSWRNAVADPALQTTVNRIAETLGPFPLGALDAGKAQRRLVDRNFRKALCPTCGPTSARLSRKAFEERIFMCGGTRSVPHSPAIVTPDLLNPKSEAA